MSICDHKHTTLEWFLGRGSTPKARREALKHCGAHAVELKGGDHVTLLKRGWVKAPPQHCKDLWPGRQNFPLQDHAETTCPSLRPPYNYICAKLLPKPEQLKQIYSWVCQSSANARRHVIGRWFPDENLTFMFAAALCRIYIYIRFVQSLRVQPGTLRYRVPT